MRQRYSAIIMSLVIAISMSLNGIPVFAADAEGTPVSTFEDLLAMENNPTGTYYLTADIVAKPNTMLFADDGMPFKGTLNGNGHKITGYSYSASSEIYGVALIGYAENATFKNLTLSDVNINLKRGSKAAGLVSTANNCTFDGIKTSGTIKMSGVFNGCAGIVDYAAGSTVIKNCTNGINITIDVSNTEDDGSSSAYAAGIARGLGESANRDAAVLSNCTNTGNISVVNRPTVWGTDGCYAAGIVGNFDSKNKITGCRNSGNISAVFKDGKTSADLNAKAAGIAISTCYGAVSCHNTGKVNISCEIKDHRGASAAGVATESYKQGAIISRCSNRGTVTINGYAPYAGEVYAGGIGGEVAKVSECYNTAKISAGTGGGSRAGGVAADVKDMRDCYNTGNVYAKGDLVSGGAGGLVAYAHVYGTYVMNNYSTGTVTTSGKTFKGQLIGYYNGSEACHKVTVKNNYYKTSGKAYGGCDFSSKKYMGKSTKVSAVTSAKCKALKSSKWVYSKKYKRLILKNNKEV